MYSKSFIEKVKNTAKIYDLASEYTKLKRSNDNIYIGICPHKDHDDKDPSFRVWVKDNTWACMVCHTGKKDARFKNYGSDTIAFIMWIENMNFNDAVKYLAEKYNIPLETPRNYEKIKKNNNLCKSYMNSMSGEPYNYLLSRGLDDNDIYKWLIGFDGNKIVFPLLDRYKNVLAFTRRWLKVPEGSNDKYKNSKNSNIFKKGAYFYGIHNVNNESDEIIITEGPLDVILSSKYGAKNVVSTLGTAFTDEHASIIKHYGKTPVFVFDGDNAGKTAIIKAAEKMSELEISCKVLMIKNNMDLAELSLELKEGIVDYINNNSLSYGTFLSKELILNYNSDLLELNMKYRKKVNEILLKIPLLTEREAIKNIFEKEMTI